MENPPKLYYIKKKLWTKLCVFWKISGIKVVEKKETIVICLNIYKETLKKYIEIIIGFSEGIRMG